MNEYGLIDYKKPIGAQNDYRTSTYRGHIKLDEQFSTAKSTSSSYICGRLTGSIGKEYPRRSEHQDEYTFKFPDQDMFRNPTVYNVTHIKPFVEKHFHCPPKPLQTMCSVYRQEFEWKPKAYEEKPPILNVPNPIQVAKNLSTNCAKLGYAKLLDPSGTTNNLTYVRHAPNDLGIAIKDNITFWNWDKRNFNVYKIKEPMCEIFRSKACPKRRAEYKSLVKHVPNNGLTTETRSNYINQSSLDFDVTHIKNRLMSCCDVPIERDTWNDLYGSGVRVQRYL